MLRPLNAPEAREPRTGRQPTTTEADVRPLRADFFYQSMFSTQPFILQNFSSFIGKR
ncbi:MAG: hypothetical protein IJZ19_14805 [Lentisphaeria bacterium]|nr:hypothetical protein [Lentisphaeria bacterium]